MNEKFEFLEHTADSKFRAYGETLEQVFENAAKATFQTMTDISKIEEKEKENIKIEAENKEELLYNWLSELIYLFSAKNLIFKEFETKINNKNSGKKLIAIAEGEKIDLNKHRFETEVKAITYHQLEVNKKNGYIIEALLDT